MIVSGSVQSYKIIGINSGFLFSSAGELQEAALRCQRPPVWMIWLMSWKITDVFNKRGELS